MARKFRLNNRVDFNGKVVYLQDIMESGEGYINDSVLYNQITRNYCIATNVKRYTEEDVERIGLPEESVGKVNRYLSFPIRKCDYVQLLKEGYPELT